MVSLCVYSVLGMDGSDSNSSGVEISVSALEVPLHRRDMHNAADLQQ